MQRIQLNYRTCESNLRQLDLKSFEVAIFLVIFLTIAFLQNVCLCVCVFLHKDPSRHFY